MNLWIRSQDRRTLLKANRIDVDDTDIICWDNDYRCSETYMGKYKSQKRALEILDEIQYKINNYVADVYMARAIYVGESQEPTYIYEMPEE